MTRLDALRALEQKVAAGEASEVRELILSDKINFNPAWLGVGRIMEGSLDAAKALHEAVLPGWDWECMNAGWDFAVSKGDPCRGNYACFDACSPKPARAWLLAIIRALIAECEG